MDNKDNVIFTSYILDNYISIENYANTIFKSYYGVIQLPEKYWKMFLITLPDTLI